MIKYLVFIFLIGNVLFAQESKTSKITGKVSYVTPQNIYIKFGSTDGIKQGDTAFVYKRRRAVPAVIIKYVSSMSCAGPKLNKLKIKVGDVVFAYVKIKHAKMEAKDNIGAEKDTNLTKYANKTYTETGKRNFNKTPRVYGSFTANSYSNFTNYSGVPGLQRWNYLLNIRAERIGGTPLYFSNNMNLAYLSSEWRNIKSNIFNKLRIYDLSLGYKTDDMKFWFGRHINYSISNVGPIDGLQAEKTLGAFGIGGAVGSRPDFYTMGFNFKYFEYGAYLNRTDTAGVGIMRNTVALFQQMYNNKTDRRFFYLQHSDNIFPDLYLFASSEIDLFKLKNNKPAGDFSLTSLYLSAQYSPFRIASFNLSYDARKSVIYYQTFRSFIDSLFSNEMRQGLRLSVYLRPVTGTFINIGGGYSYQKGDFRPTRNFNISITQSQIPFLDISATVSANRILGNYQNGSIYGISFSKYISFNSTSVMAGFSNVSYNFGAFGARLNQKQITAEISTKIINSLFFNLYYEGDFDGATTYGRFLTGINYRFR